MTVPVYSQLQEIGLPWIGPIPAHWDIAPLYSVAREREESNAGMVEDNLLSLSYGRIVRKDMSSNDGLLPESFETYQVVYPGDIVFRLTDLQNDKRSLRTALVGERGIITSAYLAVRPENVSSSYLNYLLRAYDLSKVFYSMGGGLRQSMKFSDLRRLPVLLPSPAEQAAIATFLDRETGKIDALVEEQKWLIELLKEKRQTVISHAVTKGLNPDASMKDSGVEWLGEVPEHWRVRPLKYLAKFESGGTPSKANLDYWDGDFPWASAKDLKSDIIGSTQDSITEKALIDGAASLVPAGAVVVLVRGMMLARTFPVALLAIPMAINQDLKALTSPRLYGGFLAWTLRGLEAETLSRLDEAGHGTKALRMEAWTSMAVPEPPMEEQLGIAQYLRERTKAFDELVSQAEASILLLNERRSALISAAVTGKIDVQDAVRADTVAA